MMEKKRRRGMVPSLPSLSEVRSARLRSSVMRHAVSFFLNRASLFKLNRANDRKDGPNWISSFRRDSGRIASKQPRKARDGNPAFLRRGKRMTRNSDDLNTSLLRK